MTDSQLTTTSHESDSPLEFVFNFEFAADHGNASRVFSATLEFINACQNFDQELVTCIDANIRTEIRLVDIETESLKSRLKIFLEAIDDEALKDGNWRAVVGRFLINAKHRLILWCEDGEEQLNIGPNGLQDLRREIHALASETDVLRFPFYSPVKFRTLINAIRDFDRVKDHFDFADIAEIILPNGDTVLLTPFNRVDIEKIEALAVRETIAHNVPEVVLIVKKPDYLGNSMWELRHGGRSISAKISDVEWLSSFQERLVDVRPGDALRCEVEIELKYGHDNELLGENWTVNKVHEVAENQYVQTKLPISQEQETLAIGSDTESETRLDLESKNDKVKPQE